MNEADAQHHGRLWDQIAFAESRARSSKRGTVLALDDKTGKLEVVRDAMAQLIRMVSRSAMKP